MGARKGRTPVPATMDEILESAVADFWWLPPHATVVSRPEITYVHSPVHARLYNTVARVSAPSVRYEALLDEVGAAHRERPSDWKLAAPSLDDTLEGMLEGRGYRLAAEAIATSIAVDATRPPTPDWVAIHQVTTRAALRAQYDVMDQAFGNETRDVPDEELDHHLSNSVGPDARCRRFLAIDLATDRPVATASYNIFQALGFGFLWGGSTVPEARGRGAYSALVTARMQDARARGLHHVGLHAMTTTSAPILARQGFEAHGPCRVWQYDPVPRAAT